jgi:hypothetical protein
MAHEQRPALAVTCVGLSVLAWGLAHPVRSEPLPASVRACRSVADALERVRCYDAVVDAGAPAALPAPTGPASARVEASAAAAPQPATPPAARETEPPAPSRMFTAKVVALSFRPSGAVNVTLDNGQVWTQYGPEGRVVLRNGDSVTVRPGLFGASVLVGPSGWITKVHMISAAPAVEP